MKPPLPEIVFSSSDSQVSQQISRLVRQGKLRKLLARVYTSNHEDSDEEIVRRNINRLISHLFPESILSHRSALEYIISPFGNLYLTGKQGRVYNWPGVKLRFTKGPGRQEGDLPLFDQLYVSSLERACLENCLPSRTIEGERRVVEQEMLEERLLMILNTRGESGLNELRDRARELALQLDWNKAFEKLNTLIGALLSTKPSQILHSPVATAKAFGEPYDPYRVELFHKLVIELKRQSWPELMERTRARSAYQNMAFFESYFSNYIEGTTFTLDEAQQIIYGGQLIPNRSGDTHDILGTYTLCADRSEMDRPNLTVEEFTTFLKRRHALIMAGRPDKNPGLFKEKPNRAGSSHFVDPQLVKGTLKQAYLILQGLQHPFARAVFMLFSISEIHPFDDGNGRVARVMMNAELSRAQQSKIIIPNVYREDYLLNLKRFTRQGESKGYIAMMYKAWHYTNWLNPIDYQTIRIQLESTNAFLESSESRLILPG